MKFCGASIGQPKCDVSPFPASKQYPDPSSPQAGWDCTLRESTQLTPLDSSAFTQDTGVTFGDEETPGHALRHDRGPEGKRGG